MKPAELLVLLAAGLLAAPALAEPSFRPVAVPDHQYTGGWEHYVGGGLAVLDCNGDNFPDLFAAGGESPASLLINTSTKIGAPVSFVKKTPESLKLTGVTGAYPLDIDADGILDLAILRVGENLLMKGGADCGFTPFTGLGFRSDNRWTTAFSATWEDGQSLPTLAFGNYVDRDDPEGPFGTCDSQQLYRPEDTRYPAPQPLQPGFCTLSMLFNDWSRSGRQDLRVSNDRHYYVKGGSEQMWAMEDTPRLYTATDGWKDYAIWGMGIASRDISGDGYSEIFLTSMGDQKLQSLDITANGPAYSDATYERGTTAQRPYIGEDGRPSTGWHVAFGDVQNDGRDDIFITKGNVEQMAGAAMQDPNNLLIQTADGSFTEMGDIAGIASFARGRGGALADLNRDGRLDIVVVNRRAPLEVYENTTPNAGNWLSVSVTQNAGNRRAVGAFVELATPDRVWTQEITVGGGHAGGTAVPLHFGLGKISALRLRVIWPDGQASGWKHVGVNQRIDVSRAGSDLVVKVD